MEDRTPLKEKRNEFLLLVFTVIYISVMLSVVVFVDGVKQNEFGFVAILGVPFLFVVYRVLTYCFNRFLLLFFKQKFKINRLKNRITPIYKVREDYYDPKLLEITKFEVQYTPLDLQWSIPFSVLFEEQEYIKVKTYTFDVKIDDVKDISELWEEQDRKVNLKKIAKKSAEEVKERKIQKLNQTFLDNYK